MAVEKVRETHWEPWEVDRVFLRGLTRNYDLYEELKRIRSLPRVIHYEDIPWEGGPQMFNKWLMEPSWGFMQSLNIHMKEMVPGSTSQIHGHQNDALFYVLQGTGYEIHDGIRYDWKAGDAVIVHPGCVHEHHVISDYPARVLIMKTKPLYIFLHLLFQGLEEPASKKPMPGWENHWPE
ncbi:MAG: cupin domain-containing protein [Actinobacteria bacterium]|nr:cupin domain-containing protein [Actinomycetota bacterium]